MSQNQSRGDTRESSSQYSRTGRSGIFNQHRGGGRGSGGGAGGTAPPPSNPSFSYNRSYNKKYNNAQGGQVRVSGAGGSAGSDSHQNGAHQQQPLRGALDVSVASADAASIPSAAVKPIDASTQKVTRAVPRAPTSNVVPSTPESTTPVTPAKNPGDASRSFPLQFGSISPGVMNVLQIPARTSSAPPNLDEQKRAQARSDTSRVMPSFPTTSTSKQPMPRKDAGPVDQSNPSETRGVASKTKREVQISAPPPVTQTQNSSTHPMPGMRMQLPFHQPPQVPVQFGGPGPQIPSHSMSATSLPMQMHLPIGNPPMQQPMFLSGLQPHPMQSQGMMHQGQGLNFSSGMGPQLPPQLGNMGMNMPSQFSPQQAGKFVGARKVKITHPETHEELRLEGATGSRSHPNMTPQSQPIASFPPGHPNYYHNSYNSSSVLFQALSSLPLGNTQGSQPPRLFSQVTVKPAAGGTHPGKEQSPSVSSAAFGKDPVRLSKPHGGDSAHPQIDTDTLHQSSTTQSKIGDGSKSASRPVENIQFTKGADSISGQSPAAGILSLTSQAPIESSTSLIKDSSVDAASEILGGPDSIEDQQKKQVTRGQLTIQDKAPGNSTSVSSQPSQYALARPFEVNTAASVITAVNTRQSLTPSESTELKSHITGNGGKEDSSEPLDSRNKVAGKPVLKSGDRNEVALPEVGQQDEINSSNPSSESLPVDSVEVYGLTEEGSSKRATNANIENGLPDIGVEDMNESVACSTGVDNLADSITLSTSNQDSTNTEACTSAIGLSAQDDQESDIADSEEAPVTKLVVASQEFASDLVKNSDEAISKSEDENTETNNTGLASKSSSGVKEKSLVDSDVPKVTVAKVKKRRKDLFKKADAAGATSDLYMAYKGPEKKDELTQSIETSELTSSDNSKPLSDDVPQEDLRSTKKVGEVKSEPDDWEDAADISTPKLEAAPKHGKKVDGDDATTKKYSRDFLLKFAEQCIDIPEGFKVPLDIADILINANANVSHEPSPSPGRGIDRPSSGHRERRGSGIGDVDKWNKTPGPLMPGRDLPPDLIYGGNATGFRHGPGGNYGVLLHPRASMPIQYAGGIPSGPMQSIGPQGGGLRNGVDADRWQHVTAFQKSLMPSPQTPTQIMHKAERKYEVGKVTDEEQAKQRQLKSILNKLTPQNFEKLFQQVKEVNIDNDVTLNGVISQIFDKALMEPTFCEMYANFCQHLAAELPDLSVDNEKITFRRLLLNKCQEEFERGEREEQEANVTNEEGEVKLSAEEREEKRVKARRQMLGNIRLIGELYKKRMLTERIMHECIKKLLGDYQNPDEENIEALCKLMSTIGEMIDHAKAKEHMDAYFDRMEKLSNNMKLSSRVRFMLKDSIDLRENKWQQRRKVEGPKKIEEVHRDAAQERHAQATRLARTPSLGGSSKRQPMDFAPRGSMLPSPGSQMGGFRAMSPQVRGYGMQDVRVDKRHSFENRALSLPLTQRPLGDDPITLGPQGGLARGMSSRGQPAGPSSPFTDNMQSLGDPRRMTHAQNGYGSFPERPPYGSREDLMPKYIPERLSSQHDQASAPERNVTYGSKGHGFDTSRPASPLVRSGGSISTQNVAPDKIWPEERLRDMSMAAIKEFYSVKDEKEVALCVKDLNSPSFYPSMISLWVTDSFERKDMERDLLAKLIIDLSNSRDVAISQDQLVKGFESVLTTLEDAVNDAPRAAEFLGRIFAKVILEKVIPFNEIGRLIYEGGEEEGRLVEIGLAAEVLGSTLEMIRLDQGDSVVSEICRSSNMRLENFRPKGSNKQWKLDKFI